MQYYQQLLHLLHGALAMDKAFADRVLALQFDGRRITVADLLETTSRALSILREVDARTTGAEQGSLDWVITDLRSGSAILEIVAEPKGEESKRSASASTVRPSFCSPRYARRCGMRWKEDIARSGRSKAGSILSLRTRSRTSVLCTPCSPTNPFAAISDQSYWTLSMKTSVPEWSSAVP